MNIRRAERGELKRVREFYASLIDAMEDAEFKPGWKKEIYPSPEFLERSIEAGTLYVAEAEEGFAACMVADHEYNEGYDAVQWSVEAAGSELLVIHALGVHPAYAGQGIAKQMVQRAIELARESRVKTIRLDVLGGNLPAERVYTKMGFVYRDTLRLFYEDTGRTEFRLFEYIV